MKEILEEDGKPVLTLQSVTSKKMPPSPTGPDRAPLGNPLPEREFPRGDTTGFGIAFCFIKTGALGPSACVGFRMGNREKTQTQSPSDDSSSRLRRLWKTRMQKTLPSSPSASGCSPPPAVMVFSYYHVKNYNERQEKGAVVGSGVDFSVWPRVGVRGLVWPSAASYI